MCCMETYDKAGIEKSQTYLTTRDHGYSDMGKSDEWSAA